jgi:hypothetical protein
MCALGPTPPLPVDGTRVVDLAEALVSAATELATTSDKPPFQPTGTPVRSGRLNLGRLRHRLPTTGPVMVVVGFAVAGWLGSPDERPPGLGPLAYRGEVSIDRRGRVVLDRRARAWLGVTDPTAFEAVVMPVATGGVLVMPIEGFTRRLAEVTP